MNLEEIIWGVLHHSRDIYPAWNSNAHIIMRISQRLYRSLRQKYEGHTWSLITHCYHYNSNDGKNLLQDRKPHVNILWRHWSTVLKNGQHRCFVSTAFCHWIPSAEIHLRLHRSYGDVCMCAISVREQVKHFRDENTSILDKPRTVSTQRRQTHSCEGNRRKTCSITLRSARNN